MFEPARKAVVVLVFLLMVIFLVPCLMMMDDECGSGRSTAAGLETSDECEHRVIEFALGDVADAERIAFGTVGAGDACELHAAVLVIDEEGSDVRLAIGVR